jgi:hypothetical protein
MARFFKPGLIKNQAGSWKTAAWGAQDGESGSHMIETLEIRDFHIFSPGLLFDHEVLGYFFQDEPQQHHGKILRKLTGEWITLQYFFEP